MSNSIVYPLIMLVSGIGIPVMVALNSGLGVKLGSTSLATTLLFFIGSIISLTYLLISEGMPANVFKPNISWYFYLGGVLVAFYIFSVTWVSPKLG